jgi:hypothetical protein
LVGCGSILLLFCLGRTLFAEEPATPAPSNGFSPLYNGRDLAGWRVHGGKAEVWQADGEVLRCIGPGGGWLRTEVPYGDFVLKVEYRIPAGGNSGIGVRFPAEGEPHLEGMEVQILDDHAPEHKNLVDAQYTGSLYYQAPAKRNVAKAPGDWNAFEITCRGSQVKVILNGESVVDVDVAELTEGKGGHKPLSERPEFGFIGLQSHGTTVEFRHVELKNLATTTPSGVQYTELVEGSGTAVVADSNIIVHYIGRLLDGRKFDSTRDRGQPLPLSMKEVIKGWREGVVGMKAGGRRKLVIPPELAYGERGAGSLIPPGATLVFDVEVLESQ